eukprot:s518_g31.t1
MGLPAHRSKVACSAVPRNLIATRSAFPQFFLAARKVSTVPPEIEIQFEFQQGAHVMLVSVSQWPNAWHRRMDGWLAGWMDGWLGGWCYRWVVGGRTDGRRDGGMEGWMDGWMEGREQGKMQGRKDGWRGVVVLHCPNFSRFRVFFTNVHAGLSLINSV